MAVLAKKMFKIGLFGLKWPKIQVFRFLQFLCEENGWESKYPVRRFVFYWILNFILPHNNMFNVFISARAFIQCYNFILCLFLSVVYRKKYHNNSCVSSVGAFLGCLIHSSKRKMIWFVSFINIIICSSARILRNKVWQVQFFFISKISLFFV